MTLDYPGGPDMITVPHKRDTGEAGIKEKVM